MSSINGMTFEAFECVPDTRMIVVDFLSQRMQRPETHIGDFEPDVEVYSWPQRDGEEKRNITVVVDLTSTLCGVYVNRGTGGKYYLKDPVERFLKDVFRRHVRLPGEHEIYEKRKEQE